MKENYGPFNYLLLAQSCRKSGEGFTSSRFGFSWGGNRSLLWVVVLQTLGDVNPYGVPVLWALAADRQTWIRVGTSSVEVCSLVLPKL